MSRGLTTLLYFSPSARATSETVNKPSIAIPPICWWPSSKAPLLVEAPDLMKSSLDFPNRTNFSFFLEQALIRSGVRGGLVFQDLFGYPPGRVLSFFARG